MDLSGRCRIVQFVQLVWHSDNQVTGAPVGYVGPREAKQSPLLLDELVQGRVAMLRSKRCNCHAEEQEQRIQSRQFVVRKMNFS